MIFTARGGEHKIREVDLVKTDFEALRRGRLIDEDTESQPAESATPPGQRPEGGVARKGKMSYLDTKNHGSRRTHRQSFH